MRSSEHARIARLAGRFATPSADVRLGIGDDAAWLAPDLIVSVDAQVEGVHFLPRFGPWDVLAERAAVAALSDLAAMGSKPLAMLSSLVLPKTFDDASLDALHEGLARAATRHGAPVVGGNLAAGTELSLTTTVLGRADAPLRRDGAKAGDGIWLTGHAGERALGLRALLDDVGSVTTAPFVRAWLHPVPRLREGLALVGSASACVDVSDGLVADLAHVLEASGVGAELALDALPFAPGYAEACVALGADPLETALNGGEAYELLFTSPTPPPFPATRIGEITAERRLVGKTAAGERRALHAQGFDHFG
ncbi:MAG: thiamine-phosphate kinase [Sandaracinus sp.]|nr:thiamine-phosphate kinase [Sandaracinus sp.]